MTVNELVNLSGHPLIDIQSHTHSHPILTQLSDKSLDFELKYSKELISQVVNKNITKFSYPNGSYTQREKDCVKKYYTCAFSTIQSYPAIGCDLYEIPRIALTNDYWSNLAKIVGAWKFINGFK
jgi:peptidoglycan/xylan/chitin deacetylase (PgdA/CDA1 family)